MEGLDAHQRGLVKGFFPGIAEGVLHHVGEPAAEGSRRGKGMGHGRDEESFSMAATAPPSQ